MKSAKIGSLRLQNGETITIHYTSDKVNPYWIYREWNDIGQHGIIHRRRIAVKYADLLSCTDWVQRYVHRNNVSN